MAAEGHVTLARALEGPMFLNDAEAATLGAIVDRIIPADEHSAGASQAGVVVYIDRLLAGFRQDLQLAYRIGLRELDGLCGERFGAPFANLSEMQQDDVLRTLLGSETAAGSGDATGPEDLRRLAAVIREHTIEGFFCDPIYGGNRDTAGWRLVGFPGAHWGYAPEQMALGYDAAREVPVQTLSDLRAAVGDQIEGS
jgi:gluconate 2-dehydrogenase gamma chain